MAIFINCYNHGLDEVMLVKLKKGIEKSFILFLYSQVFIDLITTIFVRFLNVSLSFGMIVRFTFMVLALIYIIMFGSKKTKILLYFLLAVFCLQFLYVLNLDSNIGLFDNIRYYLRTLFFPIITLFGYEYFFRQKKNYKEIFHIINFNLTIIILAFVFSYITNSYIPMYEDARSGSSGWFLSGNEISSILCILSFIPLYSFIITNKKIDGILLVFIIVILLIMGTKTTFIVSIIITLLLIFSLLFKTFKTKEKSHLIWLLFIFLYCSILLANYNNIPAIQNINYMVEIEEKTLYKEKFLIDSEIPLEISEKRYKNVKPRDINQYYASINFKSFDTNNIIITGYFYPMYFDLSHPKYVMKTLLLESKTQKNTIKLSNTYNKNINDFIFKKIGNDNYNGDFSGLEGYLNIGNYQVNEEYTISIVIEIDGVIKKYKLLDSITIDRSLVNNFTNKGNKYIFLNNKNIEAVEKANLHVSSNNFLLFNKFSFLLGGRNQRLVDFINNQKEYNIFNLALGTGYIKNYVNSNGFEMDIPEIFVTFGIIGFISYFSIFIQLLIDLVKSEKKIIKDSFGYDSLILLVMIIITFGLSFMVGHVLLTPSSAIYAAILLNITAKIIMEGKND